jgi:ATP-grasp domain, R2K clade family 2
MEKIVYILAGSGGEPYSPNSPEVPPDFPLLCQTPVKFLSEWRVFIAHGHVLGINQYQGDPFTFPNPNIMRLAIGAYTNAPAGYCADFGMLASGETVLVEVNDGYALGNAGLLASLYAELLRARWVEMMQS